MAMANETNGRGLSGMTREWDHILWIAAFRKAALSWKSCRGAIVTLAVGGLFLPDLMSEVVLSFASERVASVTRQLPDMMRVAEDPWTTIEGVLILAGAFYAAYGMAFVMLLLIGTAAYMGILSETLAIQSGRMPRRFDAVFRDGLRLTVFRGMVVVLLLLAISTFVGTLAPGARFLLPLGLMAPVILAADRRSMGRAVTASYSLRYARYSTWGALPAGFSCMAAGLLSFGVMGWIDDGVVALGTASASWIWSLGILPAGLPGTVGYWFGAVLGGVAQSVIFAWTGMYMVSLFNLSRRMAVA